ncbi:hypothetical protein Tco_1247624 [Tanacetum coccineum]
MRFCTDKTSNGPKVKAKDKIIESTWNLVDRSLTSAKISPLSGIVPSTIDAKYSVGLADEKIRYHLVKANVAADALSRKELSLSRKRGKLNPRYIGPFKILAKIRTVAFRLELMEQLSRVHSTFHVSSLKKCLSDKTLAIPIDEIQIDDKIHFIEEPVEIIDREVKRLKQSRILIVKVRWNSKIGPEFTWEREDQMQKEYPHLFANSAPAADVTS